MSILDDGTNILGAATPRPATPTSPAAVDVTDEVVEYVASLTIDEIEDTVRLGELTLAEVLAAEDPANGGRGRTGVRSLASD